MWVPVLIPKGPGWQEATVQALFLLTGHTPGLPQTCYQNVHALNDLGGEFSTGPPARAQLANTLILASETLLEATVKAAQISDLQNCEITNLCCLMLWFGAVVMVIVNQYRPRVASGIMGPLNLEVCALP